MKAIALVVFSIWTLLAGAFGTRAQSVTTIYSFTNGTLNSYVAGLTLGPDGNFYGTTGGGSFGYGTVFQVTTNGTLTTLVNFTGTNGGDPSGLTLGPDGNFYGTAGGGTYGFGTVFQVTTNGTFTTLVNFNGTNGDSPESSLTLGLDGNFYGTTGYSRNGNEGGSIFKVTTNGTLTTLVNFNRTNGALPNALTLGPDGNFYGTTLYGGNLTLNSGQGYGTIFKLTTNGSLTTLVSFTNAHPQAGLTLGPDGNFYGETYFENEEGVTSGTVYKVTTKGKLTTLVHFDGTNGANPSGLTLGPDGNFYGTTSVGGNTNFNSGVGYGTVFQLKTNGKLTTLVNFNSTNGSYPESLTLGPDGNFYGATDKGGSAGYGTIFRLNLPPDFIMAPARQTAFAGGSATFNSQAFGTGPFAYQWLFNGDPISGATNATLTVSAASTNDIGDYQLMVTNAFGSVTSQPVLMNVLLQPNVYAISSSGGGNYIVSLAGFPNRTNRLWTTTNPALPFAQWQLIATNVTDSNGQAQFQDTNTAGMPQKFYRLSYP